jgi:tetratricopeptide (TPR) repeat protein
MMKPKLKQLLQWLQDHRPGGQWKLVPVKSDFTDEHHLPEILPAPRRQEARVREGNFSFDEAMQWMKAFVAARRRHPLLRQFELAIRKADFYRQLAEKMDRGRWTEVDELGRRLGEIDPLDPSAALARGRAMRQMGYLANALRFYQDALKLRPTHSLALPEYAAACRAIGQPHRFERTLEAVRRKLGETHPLTIESRVQLGELVRIFADPTDPATIAHVPRQQYIQNVHMRLQEMDPDPAAAMNLGQTMLQDDMPELAEMLLDRCEGTFGQRGELTALRGMIQHHQHDLPAAETSLREAVEQVDLPAIRVELASVLTERTRQPNVNDRRRRALEKEAAQQLRLAVDRDPNDLDALHLLVEPARTQGIEAVAAELEPLAKAYPQSWAIWKILGDAYLAENRPADALRAFELGLAREKTDSLLLGHLHTLGLLERPDALLAAAEQIPDLHDRDPMLRWRVAQAQCEAKQIPQACKVLDSLVTDDEAPPPLRQRAKEILQQLQEMEEE